MSGTLDMGGNRITGVLNTSYAQDAFTKIYADGIDMLKVVKAGNVMSNNLDMNLNKITDVMVFLFFFEFSHSKHDCLF